MVPVIAHAALAIDTSEFHSGTRSLAVTFDGYSVPEVQPLQFIPVKPSTAYEFSAESRTVDIDTASGPRFAMGRLHELLLRPHRRYSGHYSLASATSTISNRAEHKSFVVENSPRARCAAHPGKALDR